MSFLHNLGHKHASASKDGIGVFWFCTSRVPFIGKCTVHFQPDFDDARWHLVPAVYEDGELLCMRMFHVADAYEAMAMLRAARAKVSAGEMKEEA